ncbi:hypothetical protein [Actinacidiphila sp. ITFR-21]|uniref:hypothetical protein n=1 Tax=Actinacidiphila sp. ITFR-21 TaxID=3075199 RepID=UPI00288968D8|nr:hypothetical protein [Streptomyces sp. ITFR-21]WNI14070.1 hypothetical protein RLT57_00025 [Streptomyces sp. ITFR-21]
MTLSERGLQFLARVLHAVQAAGLDLDGEVDVAQHQVGLGGAVAGSRSKGNPGAGELGAPATISARR